MRGDTAAWSAARARLRARGGPGRRSSQTRRGKAKPNPRPGPKAPAHGLGGALVTDCTLKRTKVPRSRTHGRGRRLRQERRGDEKGQS